MTTIITFNMAGFKEAVTQNIVKHHRLYFFEGLVFVFLGLLSILMPVLAAEITVMILGACILGAGVSQAYFNFKGGRHHWGFYISTLTSVGFGIAVLFWPEKGAIALATLIAVFLVVKGFSEIFLAGAIAPRKGWGFAILSGFITLILAAIVWSGWPVTSIWFLGIVIGLNFGMFGFSLMNISRNYKKFISEEMGV